MTPDLLSAEAEAPAGEAPAADSQAASETPAASPESSAETEGEVAPPEGGGTLLGDDLASKDGGAPEAKPESKEAPEYDLKAPEGAPFAENTLAEIQEFAAEHKLAPEAAQALTDRYGKALSDMQAAHETQVKETFEGFGNEIEADKTWGGKNLPATKAYFAKAMDKFAPGYRQSLHEAGAMLEPAQYLAWAAVGKGMSEPGSPEVSNANPSASEAQVSDSFPNTPRRLGGSKKE